MRLFTQCLGSASGLRPLLRGLLGLLFCLSLGTCGRAPQSVERTEVVGSLRYEESSQQLSADLAVSPAHSTALPTLQGNAMPPFPAAGPGHYRARRTLPFPAVLHLSVPCGEEGTPCGIDLSFAPPFVDSLPPTAASGTDIRFLAGNTALQDNENLVFFFEPADRSEPKRILLQGPTLSGRVSLPKEALTDLATGKYAVYLIKQQLHKDSLEHLQTSVQTEYFTRSVPFELVPPAE